MPYFSKNRCPAHGRRTGGRIGTLERFGIYGRLGAVSLCRGLWRPGVRLAALRVACEAADRAADAYHVALHYETCSLSVAYILLELRTEARLELLRAERLAGTTHSAP